MADNDPKRTLASRRAEAEIDPKRSFVHNDFSNQRGCIKTIFASNFFNLHCLVLTLCSQTITIWKINVHSYGRN